MRWASIFAIILGDNNWAAYIYCNTFQHLSAAGSNLSQNIRRSAISSDTFLPYVPWMREQLLLIVRSSCTRSEDIWGRLGARAEVKYLTSDLVQLDQLDYEQELFSHSRNVRQKSVRTYRWPPNILRKVRSSGWKVLKSVAIYICCPVVIP